MCIPISLPREAFRSPRTRFDGAELPVRVVPGVFLGFMAVETCFIAEGDCVASHFLTGIWLGVPLPMLPGLL